jgi:hypothetical protein
MLTTDSTEPVYILRRMTIEVLELWLRYTPWVSWAMGDLVRFLVFLYVDCSGFFFYEPVATSATMEMNTIPRNKCTRRFDMFFCFHLLLRLSMEDSQRRDAFGRCMQTSSSLRFFSAFLGIYSINPNVIARHTLLLSILSSFAPCPNIPLCLCLPSS